MVQFNNFLSFWIGNIINEKELLEITELIYNIFNNKKINNNLQYILRRYAYLYLAYNRNNKNSIEIQEFNININEFIYFFYIKNSISTTTIPITQKTLYLTDIPENATKEEIKLYLKINGET